MDNFFKKMEMINPSFYICLHFAPRLYRQNLAALFHLYLQWHDITHRIHEPTLVQLRFAWWRNQIEAPVITDHGLEILALREKCDCLSLINAIEEIYVDPSKKTLHADTAHLFKAFGQIMGYEDSKNILMTYGQYYGTQRTGLPLKNNQRLNLYQFLPPKLFFIQIFVFLNYLKPQKNHHMFDAI